MSDQILEQVQDDTRAAMKAGEKEKVSTLRMITSALQQDAKLGDGDAVAVLQRERKKRLEAATAFRDGGREEAAAAEEGEAELIDTYLPEQLSDEELADIVATTVEVCEATSMQDMGKVMGAVMAKVKGEADGNRVSAMVREQLGS